MRAANDNPKISYETESQENPPDRLGERVFTLDFCLSDPGQGMGETALLPITVPCLSL